MKTASVVLILFGFVLAAVAYASPQVAAFSEIAHEGSETSPAGPLYLQPQIVSDNDSEDIPLEYGGTEGQPAVPATPPPGEIAELPGTDYLACSAVGKCERIYCKKGECRYDQCKVDEDCTQALIDYQNEMKRRYGAASGTGNCFATKCRAILNETTPMGHPCNTDADCGGINLFSSMLGTGLERGMEMKAPFKQLLGNERVNFMVDEETAFVVLENGVITDAGDGEASDNTVNVITDVQTIESIQMGETTIEEAMFKNTIKIEGEGFFNGIKFWFAELVYDMFYSGGASDADTG